MAHTDTVSPELKEFATFKHAVIYEVPGKSVAVIEAVDTYIPIEEFKEVFTKTEELVTKQHINKLIFDKRQLRVFHQPSMEWYFIEWKERMFDLGLEKHRKLLPEDRIFVESVKIGRDKILREHPELKVHQMDIQYCDTLQEAIDS